MVADAPHELLRGRVLSRAAGHDLALELERASDRRRQLAATLGQRTERRQAPGEDSARGTLGLEQRSKREQVVAERLRLALALATQFEAPERPRELVLGGPAARDETAEGAQLVLLRLRDHEHPVRAPAHRQPDRQPAAAHATHPCETPKRDAAVAEEPQRAQQVAQRARTLGACGLRILVLARMQDEQVLDFVRGTHRHDLFGHVLERVGLRDPKPRGQLDLGRRDRHPVERCDDRRFAGSPR